MDYQKEAFKTRLVRLFDGTTSLAVRKNDDSYHIHTFPNYSAVISQVTSKIQREVTVTTAKNTVALMTSVITTNGDTAEKRLTTNYGSEVTRVDTFTANSNGVARKTEWSYHNGATATATYEAGSRTLEVGGVGREPVVLETSGRSTLGQWESSTVSISGSTATFPGGVTLGGGNTFGSYGSNKTTSEYTTENDDGTTTKGRTTTADVGSDVDVSTSYETFDANGKKIGGGSSVTTHDSSAGTSRGVSQDWGPDGLSVTSAETDGKGGMTTHTIVTQNNPDGSSTTYESVYTTNGDGSSTQTNTTTNSDGSKAVETNSTDKDGNTKSVTETYDKDGNKTSSSDTGGGSTPANKPDKSGGGYPNPDGPDGPPNPVLMGPADRVFTEYLNGVNSYLGGNVISQGIFTDQQYTPPIASIVAAMAVPMSTGNGRDLASGVAVVDRLNPVVTPNALLGAMGKLSVLGIYSGGFLAAQQAAVHF